jgi:exosortase
MRQRTASFAVALLVSTIVCIPQLKRVIAFDLSQGYDSYVIVAPAITIYLIWISRQKIFRSCESSFFAAGPLGVAGFIGVVLASRYGPKIGENDYASLTTFSLCLLLFALFLACFGLKTFKAAIFPLTMLLFSVPLPAQLAERIVAGLQAGSAVLVYWLFTLLHVPVLREGMVFTVPGVSIEIVAECSGINSSLALLITSLLVAHETLRTNTHRIILVLSTLPLSFLKNGIRIVILTMLATKVNMRFLTGNLHHKGGFVFFAIALALLFPIWKLLLKREQALFGKTESLSPAMTAVTLNS